MSNNKPSIDEYKNRLDSPIGVKRIPAPKNKKGSKNGKGKK